MTDTPPGPEAVSNIGPEIHSPNSFPFLSFPPWRSLGPGYSHMPGPAFFMIDVPGGEVNN